MKNARPLLIGKLFEIFADFWLVVAAFCAAYFSRIGFFLSSDFPFFPFLKDAILVAPVFVGLFLLIGVFEIDDQSFAEKFRKIILGALVGTMIFALVFFFRREFFFSRLMILYIFGFSTLFVGVFHFFRDRLLRKKYRRKIGILRTLVIGNGRGAERIARKFFENGSRFQIVAAIAPYGGGQKSVAGAPVLGKLDALERVVKSEKIDAIVQTEAPEHTLNLSTFCDGNFLEFLISPHILGIFSDRFLAKKIGGASVIRLSISPLFGWGQIQKRAFDLLISSFFAPIFLLKKSKSQKMATGPKEKTFEKFDGFFGEMRNVFRGEMSLVGPRPRTPAERAQMKLHERRILAVKPGIFGPPKNDFSAEIKYLSRWNFWRDAKIFFQNLKKIFKN